MPLDSVDIDRQSAIIYFVNLEKFSGIRQKLAEYLSADEIEKSKDFIQDIHSCRYEISRGLLRYLLGQIIGTHPKKIKFLYSNYGKLRVANSKVDFNISHSHNMVCFLFSYENEVGIDIEYHDTNLDYSIIKSSIMSAEENSIFQTLHESQKIDYFYSLWTKKEAILKADGRGLSYPMYNLTILDDDDSKYYSILRASCGREQKWFGYVINQFSNYSCAMAAKYPVDKILHSGLYTVLLHDSVFY